MVMSCVIGRGGQHRIPSTIGPGLNSFFKDRGKGPTVLFKRTENFGILLPFLS